MIAAPPQPRTSRVVTVSGHREIVTPVPPSHPLGSDDLRILRAWIGAEEAVPTPACSAPQGRDRCQRCRSCQQHRRLVVAAIESAIEDAQSRRVGRATLTDLYELVPARLRPYFGLPAGEGLKLLLGRWERKTGRFLPAEVAPSLTLTEAEATVYWWSIRGWAEWEMQRELTPAGVRFDRSRWVDIDEHVRAPLESARSKVRRLFGLRGA